MAFAFGARTGVRKTATCHFLHGPVELLGEDAVSVVDHGSVPVASWQNLTELLQGPLRGRMRGDVVMDDSPGR